MSKNQLIAGIVSLGVALVLFLLNINNYAFLAGSVHVSIYPAAFFALVGIVLIIRALMQRRTT